MKTYKTKSNAVRAAKTALGANAKEDVHFYVTELGIETTYYVWDAIPSITYKAPGAKPGFLSTMLSSVSRDTIMLNTRHKIETNDSGNVVSYEQMDYVSRQSMYDIGIKSGSVLGFIAWRRNDATRKHEPYITR